MYRIKRLHLFESPTYADWLGYFAAFIVLQTPAILNFYHHNGIDNAYLRFAEALLQGHWHLTPTTENGDLSVFGNKLFLAHPPLPGILLVPFVILFGAANVNTVAIATAMSCLCLFLVHNILNRLTIDKAYIPWLILGIFFGTGYWYAIFTSHHVYAFAHITSFLFQLLIINELLGKRRWWLVGVFIGCTFLTRQFTIFYVVLAIGFIGKFNYRNWVALLTPVAAGVTLFLLYNYARFGNPFDAGYRHIAYMGILKERVQQHGVFSSKYVLFNLYSVLIKGFNITFEGKSHLTINDIDLWGTSLLCASPFLIAAWKANWPKLLKIAAWTTILLIFIGQLFYHNTGFEQVNTSRFTLDFLPLLLVLTALGSARLPAWLLKGMICYAVGLNVISFAIHSLYQ